MKLILLGGALLSSCAPRMRVDSERLKAIETIAPVTFIGNRFVYAPNRRPDDAFDDDTTASTAKEIFASGVPAFLDAIRRTERFQIVDPKKVLAAKSYEAFPALAGANASGAQLAEGFRLVEPDDGEKIVKLLEEVGADAAMITFWRFSLDPRTRGVGVETATPRTRVRVWLVDRAGKIVFDDEVEEHSDEVIGLFGTRYDGRALAPMFEDPIEVCAVRVVADLSNARAKARGL